MQADDLIRANGEAEARENASLKQSVEDSAKEIGEWKELLQKNSGLVEELRTMNGESARSAQEVLKQIQDALDQCRESIAQAQPADLEKELDAIKESLQTSFAAGSQKMSDLIQQSDEYSHKENVRVYRNIQAATDQLLKKQTEELENRIDTMKLPNKPAITWVQVLTLIVAVLGLAFVVCDRLGLVDFVLKMIGG